MGGKPTKRQPRTYALLAIIVALIVGLVPLGIYIYEQITQTRTNACAIQGSVVRYDSTHDTYSALPIVTIDYNQVAGGAASPANYQFLTRTDTMGAFDVDCSNIAEQYFPLRLGLSGIQGCSDDVDANWPIPYNTKQHDVTIKSPKFSPCLLTVFKNPTFNPVLVVVTPSQ
jgi:hypothetical protein